MPTFKVLVTETVVYTVEEVKAPDAEVAKALAMARVQPDAVRDSTAPTHEEISRTYAAVIDDGGEEHRRILREGAARNTELVEAVDKVEHELRRSR